MVTADKMFLNGEISDNAREGRKSQFQYWKDMEAQRAWLPKVQFPELSSFSDIFGKYAKYTTDDKMFELLGQKIKVSSYCTVCGEKIGFL